jgi:DNA repair protein SbcC/Rad50
MIPVSLTIQGLYSYRQKQTIDFTMMTQAGLFGIFGSVGSGKSAILEAISYALYGESERLNTRDNRNYNMMNLKSNDLLIDFVFKTGNANFYRFVVRGKRNKNNFEDVKTLDRSAYKKEDDSWIPIDINSIDNILGLNYDNFHRTIIIPQGKFQVFLQLSATQRTTMLQELFNLNRYELSGKIAALENRNNANIQNLKGQMQTIGDIDPDDIAAKEKSLIEMQNNIIVLQKEQVQKQKISQEYEQLKALYQKQEEQKRRLSELQKDAATMEQLEKEIKEYESLIITFKSDFDQYQALESNLVKISNELSSSRQQLSLMHSNIAKAELEFVITKSEYGQKENLLREAEELLKLVTIRDLNEKNEILTDRSKNGIEMLEAKANAIKNNKQTLITLKEKSEQKRKELPNLALLAEIKDWFTHKHHFATAITESKTNLASLNSDLLEKKTKLLKLPGTKGFILDSCENITEVTSSLDKEKNKTEQQKLQLDKHIVHLEIMNKLDEYASELREGEPCPLCGSKHHPEAVNVQSAPSELKDKKEKQLELNEKIKLLNELEKEIAQYLAGLTSLEEQLKRESLHYDERSSKMKEHEQKFIWTAFSPDNEAQLTESFQKVETLNQELKKLNDEFNRLTTEIEKDEADREKFTKALEDMKQLITGNSSQITLLEQQLTIINAIDYQNKPSDFIKTEAGEKEKKHKAIIEKYQQEEKLLTALNQEASILAGSIKTNESTLQSFSAEMDRLTGMIMDKLHATGDLTKEYVKEVIAKQLNTIEAKKKLETYHREVEMRKNILSQLETELNGKLYDEKAHGEVNTRLSVLTQQTNELNQAIGKMQTELARIKADLENRIKLQAQLDKVELRAQDIAEMRNLFRGNAFVNYISTVYLRNLCNAANDRFFRLTRQTLSLELSSDNNFQVRDFMNEGKLRNVKTLSGGQTFQASLSLALALADSIHKISAAHENFFFLDEGFGMLDKDSLNIVFDTLKLLRKENRIVGVISHVEEMQQEIDVHLKVTNDEENGSIIKASWE